MNVRTCLASTFFLILATPSYAVNINVFKDAPVTRMTAEDLSAFRQAVINTLEKGDDGKTVEWTGKGPNTRSKITPVKTYEVSGRPCREATIETEAKQLLARGTYSFCKSAKGAWGFKSPTGATAAPKPRK